MAGAVFTAVLTVPITQVGTPPALEDAQGNVDRPADSAEGGAEGLVLTDQLDRLPPVRSTR